MNFLWELIQWFFKGSDKNEPISQPVSVVKETPIEPAEIREPAVNPVSPTFDFLTENTPQDFLKDLQTIRPLAEQFDRAREDLLKELQRLAPAKKRLRDFTNRAA